MLAQERKRDFRDAIGFCVLLGVVIVFFTVLSTEQVASALSTTGTTQPIGTTRAVFLPLVVKNAGVTTYVALLSGGSSSFQMMGTGGLLGFGMLLGLLLLSEKPLWPFNRFKK